tara:strand:- start:1092 stop:1334 length:243 start_codon:yes stop_codon:yes gene_type:complete
MKKLIFISLFIFGFIFQANAVEKKDCSNIKKLSKAYIACKSGNLKKGIVNTGSKVKQGTINKAKNFKSSINSPFKKKEKK